MTAEVEISSDTARAPAFTFPWRSISQGAPAWTEDAAIRVVVVTADDDFGGVQMHDIPAMDFHVTSIDSPDEVGTEVTQVCTHWAYRDELWPAALPNAEAATPGPTIPTDEMAEAFISAANEFPACGEDEPWISHAYRKCKAGLAAALAVQATSGQVSVAAQAAPAGVVMAQVFMAHKDAWRCAIEQMQAHVMKGDDTELRGWKNELAAFDRAYASLLEVGGHAKSVLVDDMKQELMALYNELMKQGRGMHYWNYAAAVLNRYSGELPANRPGSSDMVSVKKEDANNYCLILAALGMQEEGDPVAKVQNLLRAENAPVAHPHHCTARSADGACEECELHAQEMAEWRAEQKAVAQVVQPEPDAWLDGARFALEAVSKVDSICWLTDSMKVICIKQAAEAVRAERGRMRHQLATATEQPAQARVAELESVMTHVQEEFKKYGNNFPDGFDCRVFRFVDDVLAGVSARKAKGDARDAGTVAVKQGGSA